MMDANKLYEDIVKWICDNHYRMDMMTEDDIRLYIEKIFSENR